MIGRIAIYAYIFLMLGAGIAGVWMDCEPEFYSPPKLYWSRVTWFTFSVLFVGSFFVQPRRPSETA